MTWRQRGFAVLFGIAVLWVIEHLIVRLPAKPTKGCVFQIEMIVLGLIIGAFVLAESRRWWRDDDGVDTARLLKDGLTLLLCVGVSLLVVIGFKDRVG